MHDANEEEIRIHWWKVEFIETFTGKSTKTTTTTNKQQHLQSEPQETEDRFDCFIQLFQHLMDLH